MRTLFKILYFASLAYIVTCCLLIFLLKILPLEFKNHRFDEQFPNLFYFGVPVAILFTAARLGFQNIEASQIRKRLLKKFLISIGVFTIFFCYSFVSFGISMCDTVTGETLFIKNSSSSKIVERDFGCGATDSSPATVTIAKQTEILSLFWYYTRIDTTTLNKSEWIRVKE